MMVLVADKQGNVKQKFFYDNVPVGGKIRVFGSGYYLGSKDEVMPRWQAAVRAQADFISTDMVEDVAKVIKGLTKPS